MTRKFYLGIAGATTLLILMTACVTSESMIDTKSDVSTTDDQRKSRVDSAQQVTMAPTLKKSLITVQDTTKTNGKPISRRQ